MTKLPTSLREAAELIERREISPVELTRVCLTASPRQRRVASSSP